MSTGMKIKKLSFKGDEPKKKKKKSSIVAKASASHRAEEVDGWAMLPNATLALGPTYLTTNQAQLCLAINQTTNIAYPCKISQDITHLSQDQTEALELGDSQVAIAAEPTDIHHVFVITPSLDQPNDQELRVTLKAATGKFLTCSEDGSLSAYSEARGMQEEFTLVQSGSRVLIKSPYHKFVAVDTVAGGKLVVRADSEEGEAERWQCFVQGEFLRKARESQAQEAAKNTKSRYRDDGLVVVGNLKNMEIDNIKKFQALGQGRLKDTNESVSQLKKAKREGKLAEEMLNRRMKIKSDRYC